MPEIVQTHVVAGVVLRKGDTFLLVQEKNPKCYGQWNWPAGKVDVGSTIEETAVREVAEETGYEITLTRKLDIFAQESNPYVPMHLFLGEIISGELHIAEDELLDARWCTLAEMESLQLRDPWVLVGARMAEERALIK